MVAHYKDLTGPNVEHTIGNYIVILLQDTNHRSGLNLYVTYLSIDPRYALIRDLLANSNIQNPFSNATFLANPFEIIHPLTPLGSYDNYLYLSVYHL